MPAPRAGSASCFSGQEHLGYHDLIRWAGTQKWSSGRVGLLGSLSRDQPVRRSGDHPPHLAAICPWEGFSDLYRDLAYPGGVREDSFTVMWSVLTDRMTG